MKIKIFGRLHENVKIPLASADSHYHPMTAKQKNNWRHRLILSFKKCATSDELKRLMHDGDVVQGFVKPKAR